jgi:hypothetical protein
MTAGSTQRNRRVSLRLEYVSPRFDLKYYDFFKTKQNVKAIPQSSWQLHPRFVIETGAPLKQPTRTQGASAKAISTLHEDNFGFDFVDLGETADDASSQDHVNEDHPPLLPWREHHRCPDPARRLACPPNLILLDVSLKLHMLFWKLMPLQTTKFKHWLTRFKH